jgi:hypothetical protein
MFASAVRDRIIAASPARHLKYLARNPIRKTPTFEQFQAIVESIRYSNSMGMMPMSRGLRRVHRTGGLDRLRQVLFNMG